MSTDGSADFGRVRDEGGALKHLDDTSAVSERTREDGLLGGGKANRIVEVMADLAEGGRTDELGAAKGVGSNGVFSTVANKARGN